MKVLNPKRTTAVPLLLQRRHQSCHPLGLETWIALSVRAGGAGAAPPGAVPEPCSWRVASSPVAEGREAPAGRPSWPRGQKVLNSALPEALAHGTTDIRTEHILLAQFHDDGPASQALARLGATEERVRDSVTALRAQASRHSRA